MRLMTPVSDKAKGDHQVARKAFKFLDKHTAWKEKQNVVREIISASPRVPHKLDTHRISNVLSELNAHLRVAILLPALLACCDAVTMQQLGEDVNRSLQLLRLQLMLCFADRQNAERHSQDSEKPLDSPLPVNQSFAMKETFRTLCLNFRDTYDYRHLQFAEGLFRDSLANSSTVLPLLHQLSDVTNAVIKATVSNSNRSPYENREIQRKIDSMLVAETNATAERVRICASYNEQMCKYKELYATLHVKIKENQEVILKKLAEVRHQRQLVQGSVNTRREEETRRHNAKMAKFEKNNRVAIAETDRLIKQQFGMSRYYRRLIYSKRSSLKQLEIDALQRSVMLKTELLATQDNLEVQSIVLKKAYTVEEATDIEFEEFLKDRLDREEKAVQADADRKKRTKAAIIIQSQYRGFAQRKKYKKIKSGSKKKKGKGTSQAKGNKTSKVRLARRFRQTSRLH